MHYLFAPNLQYMCMHFCSTFRQYILNLELKEENEREFKTRRKKKKNYLIRIFKKAKRKKEKKLQNNKKSQKKNLTMKALHYSYFKYFPLPI